MKLYTYVGVDIAKAKFDVFGAESESTGCHEVFANTQVGFESFKTWLQRYSTEVWVCMESTGCYGEGLAEALFEAGLRVSVVNALQVKRFAEALLTRNKNDKVDSKVLALYGKQMQPRLFVPRKAEQKELREVVQLLDMLKVHIGQLRNQHDSTQTALGKSALKEEIASLESRIKKLDQELTDRIEKQPVLHKQVELLTSIHGIGKTTAYSLLAYLPDINIFKNAKQLAAFIGLSPRQCQSGQYKGQTRLSRCGHARLRKTLYMPALSAKRCDALAPFVERLESKGLSKKAVLGAVMRKLAHLIFGVLKHQEGFNPKLACAPK